MQINYSELFRDKALFILTPIVLLIVMLGVSGWIGVTTAQSLMSYKNITNERDELRQEQESLKSQIAQQKEDEKDPNLKKIFSLEGMNFGDSASFAPLFDNMISVAKESGIRIRSVDYNYEPAKDRIFAAKLPEYHVCELDATIVGNYTQIQRFLKTMVSEEYLVNLAQIEIVSWQRDKSVLIANLKLRFYTTTPAI